MHDNMSDNKRTNEFHWNTKIETTWVPFLAKPTQSLVQVGACTISVSSRLRYGSITRLPVLKADSEATVDTCIAIISRATCERIGVLICIILPKWYNIKCILLYKGSTMYLSSSLKSLIIGPPSSYRKLSSSSWFSANGSIILCYYGHLQFCHSWTVKMLHYLHKTDIGSS